MKQYQIKHKKTKHKSIKTLTIMGGLMDRLEQSKSLSNRKQERELVEYVVEEVGVMKGECIGSQFSSQKVNLRKRKGKKEEY
jgi:hypothetical protein